MDQSTPKTSAPTPEEIDAIVAEKLRALAEADDADDHGLRCQYCGYEYDGEGKTLPQDYSCPVCERGSEAFREF
ncbi:MAG: hypothetical protein Q4C55_05455 [Eubacterium sp.]|nr:hypothetical protein [Eubacterium sp.]